jgi:hypothetical protein
MQKPINCNSARRRRRHIRPQVSLGSENWVLAVLTEATSLVKPFFSSTEIGATFSTTGGAGSERDSIGGLAVMVDAGLSSLDTSDSMAVTCSPISSTRGKNESTTESSIP